MAGSTIAWETLLAGAGDRFTLDYVLIRPPEAFHGTRVFPDRQWRAVLGNRPAVNVESVTPVTGQVVRVRIIVDRSIRLGATLPEIAVITGEGDSPLEEFFSPRGQVGAPVTKEYLLTKVERSGKGSVADVAAAEENDADALRDPRVVQIARNVTDTVQDTASAGFKLAPTAVVVGALLAGFLLVKG